MNDLRRQGREMEGKLKKKSRTLWFNGVMGALSMAIAGAEFFTGFIKEIAPAWVYILLLVVCGMNNAANWWLRLRTSEPVK